MELTLSTEKDRKKMTAAQRQRMQLVMAAFNAGVKTLEAVRANKIPTEDGMWWGELAPLRRQERQLVWRYLGEHFGIPKEKHEDSSKEGRGEAGHPPQDGSGLQFEG